jgi:hypothetical protein
VGDHESNWEKDPVAPIGTLADGLPCALYAYKETQHTNPNFLPRLVVICLRGWDLWTASQASAQVESNLKSGFADGQLPELDRDPVTVQLLCETCDATRLDFAGPALYRPSIEPVALSTREYRHRPSRSVPRLGATSKQASSLARLGSRPKESRHVDCDSLGSTIAAARGCNPRARQPGVCVALESAALLTHTVGSGAGDVVREAALSRSEDSNRARLDVTEAEGLGCRNVPWTGFRLFGSSQQRSNAKLILLPEAGSSTGS